MKIKDYKWEYFRLGHNSITLYYNTILQYMVGM